MQKVVTGIPGNTKQGVGNSPEQSALPRLVTAVDQVQAVFWGKLNVMIRKLAKGR
jgi:hypothetical protein